MNEDFRRIGLRGGLISYAHPTVGFVVPGITPGSHRVCENEKLRRAPARGFEPFQEQRVFVLQHRLQPLPADVALARAINRVAHSHVVGRNRFGDGAGGAADAEKPARDLLPRADLGERAVFRRVQIDLERLLVRARYFALHTYPIIQEPGVQTSLKKNLA